MQRDTFLEILEISNNPKIFLELAVDLREKVDLDQIQRLAQLLHLPVNPGLSGRHLPLQLPVKILEITQIQHIILLEIYRLHPLVAPQQLRLHVDSLPVENRPLGGFDPGKLAQVLPHKLQVGVEAHLELLVGLGLLVVLYFFGEEVGRQLVEGSEDILGGNSSNILSHRFRYKFIDVRDVLLSGCGPGMPPILIFVAVAVLLMQFFLLH